MTYYFVIWTSDDGESYLGKFTKEELEKLLNDKHWGNIVIEDPSDQHYQYINLSEQSKMYIIKGQAIIPKPLKIVERMEVE